MFCLIVYDISGGQKPTIPPPTLKEPPMLTPPPTPPPEAPKPKNMNYDSYDGIIVTATPYPNNGLILQSLNYIQMDAFSSLFPNNNNRVVVEENKTKAEEKAFNYKREPAILSSALYNIENNFRSLF